MQQAMRFLGISVVGLSLYADTGLQVLQVKVSDSLYTGKPGSYTDCKTPKVDDMVKKQGHYPHKCSHCYYYWQMRTTITQAFFTNIFKHRLIATENAIHKLYFLPLQSRNKLKRPSYILKLDTSVLASPRNTNK